MMLQLKKLKYHRDKEGAVDITEPQALLMIGDIITASLAQNGFTADLEVKE